MNNAHKVHPSSVSLSPHPFLCLTLSLALMSAPWPNRRATMSRWPLDAAMCSAVRPLLSFVCSWKVDLDSRRLTTVLWPF